MLDPTISDPSESPIYLSFELPIFRSSKLIEFIQFIELTARTRGHPKGPPSQIGHLRRPLAEPPWAILPPKSRPATSSFDFWAPFWSIGKRPKKHPFPEPPKISKVGPNVAFIQGLILFFEPNYVDSVPKITILVSPPKSILFFNGPLEGPGSAKQVIKSWSFEWPGASWSRPGRDLDLIFAWVLI